MMRRMLMVMAVLLWGAATPLLAQTKGERVDPVDVYIRSAKIALGSNPPEWKRALENLETARANYPENFEVHFLLGTIWAEKEEIDSMVVEYDLAKRYATEKQWKKKAKNLGDIYRNKWINRYNRAASLVSQSDSLAEFADTETDTRVADSLRAVVAQIREMAAEALGQCTILQPDDYRAYSTRGLIGQRLGKVEESLQDFVKAESLFHRFEFGDSVTDWYDTTAFFSGPDGEGTKRFKEYQAQFKKLSEEHRNRYRNMEMSIASGYYDTEQWDKCVAVYRRFHGMFPEDINAIVTLADIFARLEMETEAFKWQETVVRRNPDSKDTWYNMGIFFYNTAIRLQDSIVRYDKMLAEDPANADARDGYIKHWKASLGTFAKAIPRFRKVVEIEDKDNDTWRLLAICYFSTATLLAEMEFTTRVDQSVRDEQTLWALDNLKTLLEKEVDQEVMWKDTYDKFRKATELFPDEQGLCRMMKVTLARLGNVEEMREWAKKCP